jgi:hypothetical protein
MISYVLYLAILTTAGEIHAAPVGSFSSVAECHQTGAAVLPRVRTQENVTIARYYCVESTQA